MNSNLDIAVCGAGPVGLALAAQLALRGVAASRIGLIDARTVAQASLDPRLIALSFGSRQILEEIGAWPIAATEIHQIHVSRRGHFGRTLIERGEHNLPALGYVCHYGAIVTALAAVCEKAGIAAMRPARLSSCAETETSVTLQITDAASELHVISTAIAVQAEGGLFTERKSHSLSRDYGQTAIVAEVGASAPISNLAFERFTGDGPLALLPHDGPQGQTHALVWCVGPVLAKTLLNMDDNTFLAALEQTFGNRLGRFVSATQRHGFALGLNARPLLSARIVAIGNAAQTLHPVAGQGLNLGLRDAAVLARLLAQEVAPRSLENFSRLRQDDRNLTVRVTDAMARAFASSPDHSLRQTLLGLSLGMTDLINPVRHVLAELMIYGRR